MDFNKNCAACNIKIDKNEYKKYRTISKSCYNNNKRENNKNISSGYEIRTSHQQQIKIGNIIINKDNRTLIMGFFNCGKTCLMNYFLLQKQESIFIIKKITKSIS